MPRRKPEPAFQGRAFKASKIEIERWRKTFANLESLEATLTTADAFYADNPPDDGKVFSRIMRWLEKENRQAQERRHQSGYGGDWW